MAMEQLYQAFPFLRPMSVTMLAQKELEEARRSLLVAQSSTEYAQRVADYHQDRINRLTAFLLAEAMREKK